MTNTNHKGQSLIELLVTMGLLTIFMPALVSGLGASRLGKAQQSQRLDALEILKETEEATRAVRDNDWENVKTDGTYHPNISGNTWILSSGTDNVNGFTRSIAISGVLRDSSTGVISPTGTIPDPSVKKVDLRISWTTPNYSHLDTTFYLSRFVDNTALPGSGTIQPLSGHGDWCNPLTDNYNRLNLYHSSQPSSIIAGINKVYVGTTKDSSGYAFDDVSIDHSITPFALTGETNYQSPGLRANDVFTESIYAYIAPDSNNQDEVIILDVSGANPSLISAVNFNGNKGSKTLYVSHNSIVNKDILFFVASNNNLYSYDITDRNNPIAKGVLFVGDTSRIFVVDNYVFLAQISTANQFQIIDASDPTNLRKPGGKGFLKLNDQPGQDVFVNIDGTRAYFITRKSDLNPEFFIINISDKTNPVQIGTGYDTYLPSDLTKQMDPKGVTVINKRAIVVGFGSPPYQVFRIESDNYDLCKAVTTLGSFTVDNLYDVSSILNNGHAYSYLIADNSSAELQIIEGGSGEPGGSGMYESSTFDAGHDVAWNNFTATSDPNLSYKFSLKHGSSGSCTGVTFTDTDFNTFTPGPLPLTTIGSGYTNPAQCMRYRVVNSGSTAASYTITINYSP
ncbi:hypothetical protein A3K29_02690 [Candidatus Collierbacteria bacterium RIFOXYB2_FULL_46_14]|uniref:Uncharacterized protein n=1 Tax=Candidatus Collierbacteria bacterium GW2011_GWA2_46_26 TaxID=1618381 RepID=A0A0G1SKR3_9BACT|nr:MAG: hypothetical protein UW29_C0004G0043 [Candidatus Collierbacteria bacterium GW2011_GWC2_44_13]KKU33905.1 MAG: hypothetical protein UX47_C0001G0188 [Candidatus Collierbacteria bacterium GW2011_GWA2_46_26]OGD73026.1 MAG: hypothetical protein A3K29_02690 [Candidatus Collierbacteria bacterium RIFOXYB2_FULL_46_14]OGD76068.1 MAG: hypothetical protein A3K43_02690 [Candidatus Collierbacteria bacterium RIFOXYA2_FULL_46_20]OGD77404.1 MAG: hypothetical protein A3K39_02690 [Candidatus Collierbacteri